MISLTARDVCIQLKELSSLSLSSCTVSCDSDIGQPLTADCHFAVPVFQGGTKSLAYTACAVIIIIVKTDEST